MNEENGVFIKLLEFGEKAGPEGTDPDRAVKWLAEQGVIGAGNNRHKELATSLFWECFSKDTAHTSVLKAEYYFRLLEYRELKLARSMAADAKRQSTWSIMLAISAMFISTIVGIIQILVSLESPPW